LAFVLFLQLAASFLAETYSPIIELTAEKKPDTDRKTALNSSSQPRPLEKLPRGTALFAAFTCLAAAASFSVFILANLKADPFLLLVMVLGLLGAVLYFTPPVSLDTSGFGEIIQAFLVVFMTPVFAFLLQTGEFHRLVGMTAFPLCLVYLAGLIALELPEFTREMRSGHNRLLQRLGWQNAMTFHNLLILSAFLIVALAGILGMPLAMVLSLMIPLPLAVLEIWQMWRISQGAPPNWRALRANAIILFGALVYLAAFTYWTR
jgi:1,4-dihydroxy-2-naphthoate octaprenyltransferase